MSAYRRNGSPMSERERSARRDAQPFCLKIISVEMIILVLQGNWTIG